jgi:hypothetical protein
VHTLTLLATLFDGFREVVAHVSEVPCHVSVTLPGGVSCAWSTTPSLAGRLPTHLPVDLDAATSRALSHRLQAAVAPLVAARVTALRASWELRVPDVQPIISLRSKVGALRAGGATAAPPVTLALEAGGLADSLHIATAQAALAEAGCGAMPPPTLAAALEHGSLAALRRYITELPDLSLGGVAGLRLEGESGFDFLKLVPLDAAAPLPTAVVPLLAALPPPSHLDVVDRWMARPKPLLSSDAAEHTAGPLAADAATLRAAAAAALTPCPLATLLTSAAASTACHGVVTRALEALRDPAHGRHPVAGLPLSDTPATLFSHQPLLPWRGDASPPPPGCGEAGAWVRHAVADPTAGPALLYALTWCAAFDALPPPAVVYAGADALPAPGAPAGGKSQRRKSVGEAQERRIRAARAGLQLAAFTTRAWLALATGLALGLEEACEEDAALAAAVATMQRTLRLDATGLAGGGADAVSLPSNTTRQVATVHAARRLYPLLVTSAGCRLLVAVSGALLAHPLPEDARAALRHHLATITAPIAAVVRLAAAAARSGDPAAMCTAAVGRIVAACDASHVSAGAGAGAPADPWRHAEAALTASGHVTAPSDAAPAASGKKRRRSEAATLAAPPPKAVNDAAGALSAALHAMPAHAVAATLPLWLLLNAVAEGAAGAGVTDALVDALSVAAADATLEGSLWESPLLRAAAGLPAEDASDAVGSLLRLLDHAHPPTAAEVRAAWLPADGGKRKAPAALRGAMSHLLLRLPPVVLLRHTAAHLGSSSRLLKAVRAALLTHLATVSQLGASADGGVALALRADRVPDACFVASALACRAAAAADAGDAASLALLCGALCDVASPSRLTLPAADVPAGVASGAAVAAGTSVADAAACGLFAAGSCTTDALAAFAPVLQRSDAAVALAREHFATQRTLQLVRFASPHQLAAFEVASWAGRRSRRHRWRGRCRGACPGLPGRHAYFVGGRAPRRRRAAAAGGGGPGAGAASARSA